MKEHLITQNLFCTVIHKISAKQPMDKIPSLEIQFNELTALIKNNEVSAIKGRKMAQYGPFFNMAQFKKTTRFCEYCRSHGHSISTCNKTKLDDDVQKRTIAAKKEKTYF